MMSSLASAMALRMGSPPGTSPRPMLPELSVSSTTLRVNQGAWAPLRLSNMLSCPATGMICTLVMTGGRHGGCAGRDAVAFYHIPAFRVSTRATPPVFQAPGSGREERGRSSGKFLGNIRRNGFPAMQQRLFQLRLAMGGRREFRVEAAPRQIMELCQHLGRPWMLLSGQGQGFVAEYRYHATSRTRQRELERIEAGFQRIVQESGVELTVAHAVDRQYLERRPVALVISAGAGDGQGFQRRPIEVVGCILPLFLQL